MKISLCLIVKNEEEVLGLLDFSFNFLRYFTCEKYFLHDLTG
ncbi:hypothetical protein J2Y40_000078 [Chryseobacterium sp. 2987]|nr:hypothetical protein [Chryseobacterium sp. 2987]